MNYIYTKKCSVSIGDSIHIFDNIEYKLYLVITYIHTIILSYSR